MSHPVVRCIEFVELATDWMEDDLDDDTRLAFEEHLIICPDCPEYVRQLRSAVAELRREHRPDAPPTAPPPGVRDTLRREFRARHGGTT